MSNTCVWAGIGSRQTGPFVLEVMAQFAKFMASKGHTLSTGGAVGADSAFMQGCAERYGEAQIYLPWPGYKTPAPLADNWQIQTFVSAEALALAAKFHPAWSRCSCGAQALHARNGYIVLGPNLNEPVKFVVCWTEHGLGNGGTGQALRIARCFMIPVLDLGQFSTAEEMQQALNALYKEHCSYPKAA